MTPSSPVFVICPYTPSKGKKMIMRVIDPVIEEDSFLHGASLREKLFIPFIPGLQGRRFQGGARGTQKAEGVEIHILH